MGFESKRLRVQLHCPASSAVQVQVLPKTIRETICLEPTPTIHLCQIHHSCFQFGSPCALGSCGHNSPILVCPQGSDPCFGSPVIDTPVTPQVVPQDPLPIELDPEDPEVALLRPEHLPRLRGLLQMELAQIEEIAERKAEIESRLEELDSAEKELKKRSGGR
jgi:hypothetical protein